LHQQVGRSWWARIGRYWRIGRRRWLVIYQTKLAGVDKAINIFGTSKNANLPDVFALSMGKHEQKKILYFLATLKSNARTRHCAVLFVQTHKN
jgi:hypothetical protein